MDAVTITAPRGPIRATVRLPRSKSVANRALIAAALAGDVEAVRDPGDAADVRLLLAHLRHRGPVMHCGSGGTTFRFLVAWAAVQPGEERLITGEPRLLQRPHQALVEALRHLGAGIEREPGGLRVRGRALQGGTVHLHSSISSQFISALMLVAPAMTGGVRITRSGLRLSEPYVLMTAQVMRRFGADVRVDDGTITVAPGAYRSVPFAVPPDWSAAAFWYEVAGLAAGAEVLLEGLHADGLQGDAHIATVCRFAVQSAGTTEGTVLRSRPAVHRGDTDLDLTDAPDLFQPLACLYAGLGQDVHITGLHNLRFKETSRIEAIAHALARLGLHTAPRDDRYAHWPIEPMRGMRPAPFDPLGDHRMAMALAPLCLVTGRISIAQPQVVEKSYPAFWQHLAEAGFGVRFHTI